MLALNSLITYTCIPWEGLRCFYFYKAGSTLRTNWMQNSQCILLINTLILCDLQMPAIAVYISAILAAIQF